jgi:hypothetical protein
MLLLAGFTKNELDFENEDDHDAILKALTDTKLTRLDVNDVVISHLERSKPELRLLGSRKRKECQSNRRCCLKMKSAEANEESPLVLITVDGGVADYSTKGKVKVLLVDYDSVEAGDSLPEIDQGFLEAFPEFAKSVSEIKTGRK